MSWVPIMLKRIRGLFVQNNNNNNNNNNNIINNNKNSTGEVEDEVDLPCETIVVGENKRSVDHVDLPYEIIADILSRLPAKTALLCVGACKPLLAITNTPVIAFHCQPRRKPQRNSNGNKCTEVVNVCFTQNNTSENYTIRSMGIDVCPPKPNSIWNCVARLYGSCDGLLLFKHVNCESFLFIWNPVTGEQNTVIPTRKGCHVRGFFFHPKENEYKVIFLTSGLPSGGVPCFKYHMYGLKTQTFRLIASYSYAPLGFRNPILLNGVLHWKVSDEIHKAEYGVYPECSNSILLFNIYTEKFSTMSHPGRECGTRLRGRHTPMQLMKNEGHLYYCDPSAVRDIIIWRLEDYENKVWVKIHVIREPHKVLYGIHWRRPLRGMPMALDIHKDEVILCLNGTDLVLYNMSSCSFRRIGKQFTDSSVFVYPFYHVDSLVSLHTNNDRL